MVMVSKRAAVGAAIAVLFAATGCKQEAQPPKIAPEPPSAPSPGQPQTAAPAAPAAGAPGPAERAGRAMGEVIDDVTLTAKVKAALLESPDIKGLDVKVQTEKGIVQLSGFVANQSQIDKAVEVAKGVNGVKEVQ